MTTMFGGQLPFNQNLLKGRLGCIPIIPIFTKLVNTRLTYLDILGILSLDALGV